ncbi:hypothetical protein UAW_02392 [Enterococcus haemoperoxidus ATCC BAA-382]|uniref:Small integral membrane protein n=1 Tax=Enterococcus haemoperoxidus ATCC BAA-382 TaxID=1158608 RepID=R2SMA3_9ENTE|nr:DUF2273 domain-containing protein [Enterococcus haemoperoxidus]EOH93971.1 hypothetical protein UAW_02392 [Enterococcus haemoperoxidus ATCC BAA-382]EOT63279.1 hypothetical protein I583_00079 [Enterococcus haemoperoxidus ATCC BAA-382]OJG54052.1 hypothetical protein RV06_GL000445 [Enterococcus haemoperoxidus]
MKKQLPLAPYRNQIVFTTLAVLVAILFMTIGFWKTVLLVALTGIGYLIGKTKDEKRSISSILASIQAFFER